MIYLLIYFFFELDILDLHLHEMNGIVDKFIIVEYPFDYARKERPLYYEQNKERFKDFHNKIIHIVDSESYGNKSGMDLFWARRNSSLIMDSFKDCKDDDFVIACDSDVVLKRSAFENFDITKPTTFHLRWCLYWFNHYSIIQAYAWIVATPYHICKKIGHIAKLVGWQPGPGDPPIQVIGNAGFHFGKTGGVKGVIQNIRGYPHQEFASDPRLLDPVQIQKRIDICCPWNDYTNGESQGAKDIIASAVTTPYDPNDYPQYINEHPEIYSKYFKGGMELKK